MNVVEETKIDEKHWNWTKGGERSAPLHPYLIGMKWRQAWRTRQAKQQFHPAIEDGKWIAELYFYFIYPPICHSILPSLFTITMEPIGWFARISITRGSEAGANPAPPCTSTPLFRRLARLLGSNTDNSSPFPFVIVPSLPVRRIEKPSNHSPGLVPGIFTARSHPRW